MKTERREMYPCRMGSIWFRYGFGAMEDESQGTYL